MSALEGLRVLDLSLAEAGPVCGQWLAWYGADVVKVQLPPETEVDRAVAESGLYEANNMNKRSLALDLRRPEGLDILLRMVPRFDVLIENFRVGVAERMGFGYEELREIHPGLIYCSIKGFGRTGPYRDYPVFDPVGQAAGGAMAQTGFPDGPPIRSNYTVADHITGTAAVGGVLAAYTKRLRTGEGDLVELSMQEAQMSMLRSVLCMEAPDGSPIERRGSRMTPPTDVYPCTPFGPNDYVQLTVPGDRLFDRFAIAIDQPDLVVDERFSSHEARRANGEALWEIVAEWTRERTKWEAMDHLAAHGVPASAVFDNVDLLTNHHLREREAMVDIEHPRRGARTVVGNPVRLHQSPVAIEAAPSIGEHTVELLEQELGLTADEIATLEEQGVIDPSAGRMTG